jgi:hypothetical protein
MLRFNFLGLGLLFAILLAAALLEMPSRTVEQRRKVRGNASEDVAEPDEGINVVQFARTNEAAQNGHGLAAAIAAEERPIVSSDSQSS